MTPLASEILTNIDTFRDFFHEAHDLVHLIGTEGNIIYVNRSWSEHLEYPVAEVEGRSIYELVAPQDRELFRKYREDVLEGRKYKQEIQIALLAASGAAVIVEGVVSVGFVRGIPCYTRGIFRDVTMRIRNEESLRSMNEELRRRESNLEQLLHHAPDAVVVIDAESVVTYWNPKAEKIFGWAASEAIGQRLSALIVPPQHRQGHDEGMKRYVATREPHVLNQTIEITALRKNGQEFYVSLTISPSYQKGTIAFIAFIRDIDMEKRNDIELEQKRRELERSNQELERFAHVASHDMKEPLRKIRVFLDQLRTELGPDIAPTAQRFLEKTNAAAVRLTKLIEGVLSFSSIKGAAFETGAVELTGVLQQVCQDLELMIAQTGAQVRYEKLPRVHGAAILLYQLFYNLVNNSLKFSRADETNVVELSARVVSRAEVPEVSASNILHWHEISISDRGVGFRQDQATTIFEAFARLHSRERYEGTGLGLSLCKNIVERHGGRISAFAKENEGATFRIWLPAIEQG